MVDKEELVKCVQIAGRGRGLVATRPVVAGQIIVRESSALLYVSDAASLSCCGACLRACRPLPAPCPDCRSVAYCSSACRSSHSPLSCAALSRVKAAGFEPEAADQARFLLAAHELALLSPAEFEKLLLLEGDGRIDEPVRRLHAFVEDTVSGWPWSGAAKGVPSLEVTAGLLTKDARNAFGHMAPGSGPGQRSLRGCGFYPTASLFNHDCLPNACRFDYLDAPGGSNTDIFFRALHDIPENAEVTISYFPINWSFRVRQTRLAEEYGFTCACGRCAIERTWSDDEEDSSDEDEGENETSLGVNEASCREIASGSGHNSRDFENGEEKEENEEEDGDVEDDRDDFGHALYFVKYLCPVEECGGTMAPLPSQAAAPASQICPQEFLPTMECNMCGHIRTGDEFYEDVREHGIVC